MLNLLYKNKVLLKTYSLRSKVLVRTKITNIDKIIDQVMYFNYFGVHIRCDNRYNIDCVLRLRYSRVSRWFVKKISHFFRNKWIQRQNKKVCKVMTVASCIDIWMWITDYMLETRKWNISLKNIFLKETFQAWTFKDEDTRKELHVFNLSDRLKLITTM